MDHPVSERGPGAGAGDEIVCFVMFPDEETGARVARSLVEERLAACVNLVGRARSIYAWKGQICDEAEVLGVVKTTRARFEALRSRVLALHPYEVPEVIALPIVAGHDAYLAWLRDGVTPSG